MAPLTVEEENYVRMSLLLTGISPRAVRTFFDSEFPPACLEATMKKEYNKLFDLQKKHIINQSEWNLLFPIFPDVPDSKTFDGTLMTLLLQNLTPLNPPLGGFDRLPSAMETSPASDLTRIKYYWSFLVHLDDGKLDTTYMTTAWTDMTGAIDRLGGQQMKQECDLLKNKPLDQTNRKIMTDIKHSNNEINKSKESFKSLKRSYELLQEEHAKVKKEFESVITVLKDAVPWNIRGQECLLLKCGGHLVHCIQDERLSRTFKGINNKALKSIVCEDPTIPDFVKLTYMHGLIKQKEFSCESWEDMFRFTIVNKKPVFRYFLLANAENIMTTDQPKFHDILQQALCNAMTNQDKETARGISWFIVRKFYRSLSSSLKGTIIDTWPSFECKCDDRNTRKTVQDFCSSSMIIIIETEKTGTDFPKTFWKVNVKYITNDKIDKNECTEIHKKLQTSLSEVHFPKEIISGVDAKTVFTEHSNLTLICKSLFKSKGFKKNEHEIFDIPCVQLYCKSKGAIPVGESHFPKTICGLQTDILEGSPCYLAGIRVGDEIGTDEFKRGTLGGFLLVRGVKTFLTCLHVFLNVDELSTDNVSLNDEKLSMVKLYPRSSAGQNSHECGYIREIAFQVDNEKETSIDAALIEFTAGTSIDSQDYMALEYGKKSHVGMGMNSDYLNNSCVDYRPLCFSNPRPILQTVSVGAVSGYSDCSSSEVVENTEKSVDLESIGNVYDESVLNAVKEIAKQIISYFQSIPMVGIPDLKTIEQYIEKTCDPGISADDQIKAILCNIVTQVCLKLQSNTNESVENIIQKVALLQPHSSFSVIIGNVHMQKKILKKTRDNMATKRIMRRVYNQLHIFNIPFKPGDSGTCIYVLSPVKGCIGMAIANHPLGGCIATPIMEILKHFKIGIR